MKGMEREQFLSSRDSDGIATHDVRIGMATAMPISEIFMAFLLVYLRTSCGSCICRPCFIIPIRHGFLKLTLGPAESNDRKYIFPLPRHKPMVFCFRTSRPPPFRHGRF